MFVLGRDIVYDRSAAFSRDVSCEKPKTQITSTVVQYHSLLETAGKLAKPARDHEYPWEYAT